MNVFIVMRVVSFSAWFLDMTDRVGPVFTAPGDVIGGGIEIPVGADSAEPEFPGLSDNIAGSV